MIANLTPYPTMKDSGLPWLGQVPVEWRFPRAKTVLQKVDVRSATGEEELLTVSSQRGVVPRRTASVTMFQAESYVGHKLCWPEDLVINSLWAWARGLGVSQHHGIVSTAYGVYRVRDKNELLPEYLNLLVRSEAFHWELQVRSKGVWISRLQLTDESFLNAPLLVPPKEEQAAIVRFLDHVDRRIRRHIRAKQTLIKLLEEQKQSIIHRAVTRGLDPDVRLKPSGVEWLGDVPEHWEVTRLGRVVDLITGFPFKSEGFTQEEEDIKLLRGINISPGRLRWNDVVYWSSADSRKYAAFDLRVGDIVLGMDRPIIQSGTRVASIEDSDLPALLLQRVARIRPKSEFRTNFLMLLLVGKSFAEYLAPIFTGISVPHLSPEQIRSFRALLPPLDEQDKILAWTATDTKKLGIAVEQARQEIELLREYRTRLIADVVTGKLDVREAASLLPDEVEPVAGPEDEAPVEDDEGSDQLSGDATEDEAA